MATDEVTIDPVPDPEAEGWVRSVGLGPGRHWRRGREHLREHGGTWSHHVDAARSGTLAHLVWDVLPMIAAPAAAIASLLWLRRELQELRK